METFEEFWRKAGDKVEKLGLSYSLTMCMKELAQAAFIQGKKGEAITSRSEISDFCRRLGND